MIIQIYLLAAALATSSHASPAPAPAQAQARALAPRWPVADWVTVDDNGLAHTVTPSVPVGATTTASPPPYFLTGTVFAMVSGTGPIATTTATLPPPPTATASSGAGGVFAVCDNMQGEDAPFCQPRRGSALSVGTTYYITWDATYFADAASELVSVSAVYSPSGISVFQSIIVPASRGYLAWTPDQAYLQGRDAKSLSLVMAYNDTDGAEYAITGGLVSVVRDSVVFAVPAAPNMDGGWRRTVGIVVGVVVGAMVLFLLVAIGCCLWRRGREKAIRRRSSQGYGIGKSRAQRVVDAKGGAVDIQLNESPVSPRAASGPNVFREEIERQARDR